MLLNIDGKEYIVPSHMEQTFVAQFEIMMQEKYAAMDSTLRLAMKPVARTILMMMEKKYGREIRPAKGADPSLHLMKLFLGVVRGGMALVEAHIGTEENSTSVTSFSLSLPNHHEGRGSLATDGDIGEWENDGRKDARPATSAAVSNQPSLHSGQ